MKFSSLSVILLMSIMVNVCQQSRATNLDYFTIDSLFYAYVPERVSTLTVKQKQVETGSDAWLILEGCKHRNLKIDSAEYYFEKVSKSPDPYWSCVGKLHLANVYCIKNFYPRSLDLTEQVLSFAREEGHLDLEYGVHYIRGKSWYLQGDVKVSREYFEKALAICSEYKPSLQGPVYYALTAVCQGHGVRGMECIPIANKSIDNCFRYNLWLPGIKSLVLKYASLNNNNHTKEAKEQIDRAIFLSDSLNFGEETMFARIHFMNFYLKRGKVNEAIQYFNQLTQGAHNSGIDATILYNYFINALEEDKQFEKANKVWRIRDSATQEMYRAKVDDLAFEMEGRFNLSEKQREIEKLAADKRFNQTLAFGFLGFAFVFAAFIFFILKNRQKRRLAEKETEMQRAMVESLLLGEEKERKRLAQELHDGVSQLLSGVKMNLSAVGEVDETAIELLNQSMKEVRHISHNLLPTALSSKGLAEALQELCAQLNRSDQLEALYTGGADFSPMSLDQQTHLYRILQELVNNVLKHAKASELLLVTEESHLAFKVSVIDNGIGINDITATLDGIGWKNILSRLQLLKGEVSKQNNKPSGTIVSVTIPKP